MNLLGDIGDGRRRGKPIPCVGVEGFEISNKSS